MTQIDSNHDLMRKRRDYGKSIVPPDKWTMFHKWALKAGYYRPKLPYRGLLESNGCTEWNALMVFGCSVSQALTGQLCLVESRKVMTVVDSYGGRV